MLGCRPIIGLDGCHLKGPYGGQLLAAVGMDPNDAMYPVAWAVVDAENTDNWHWFIRLLKQDLNIQNDASWTFISDKQKGLINALEVLCPNAEHRFCVMHLCRNMCKDHKSMGLRNLLWQAAKSTTDYLFDKNMALMEKMNKKCHGWLIEKPKAQWSRSCFRTTCKSDMFVNNHCEVFNSSIGKLRNLPILTLLKEIHKAVMCRIQKRRSDMLVKEEFFCPNAIVKLKESNTKSVRCHVTWSGGPRFAVKTSAGGYEIVVDLEAKSCACRKWQLNGIPCFHAVACMNSRVLNLEDGIHVCYSKEMYMKVYNCIVEPINGSEAWTKTGYTQPLPPNVKVPTGRPKVKRNKKNDIPVDATSLKRQNTSLKCSHCRTWRHNSRTCPAKKNDTAMKGTTNVSTTQVDPSTASEFTPGASQPTTEVNESQGGIFQQSVVIPVPSSCGVAPKAWQNRKKTVTTRIEILRARSAREKKLNKKYLD